MPIERRFRYDSGIGSYKKYLDGKNAYPNFNLGLLGLLFH